MRIHPGYVYVNSDNNIKGEESKEDNIYEKLFSSLFKSVPANINVLVSAFCRMKKSKQFDFNPLDKASKNQVLPCFRRM
jgi:hypothetical protein